jgi:hypothetical protein
MCASKPTVAVDPSDVVMRNAAARASSVVGVVVLVGPYAHGGEVDEAAETVGYSIDATVIPAVSSTAMHSSTTSSRDIR